MPFVILDPLSQHGDVVRECLPLCRSLPFDLLASPCIRLELCLQGLQFTQVLVLHFSILDFDNVELLLVLARGFAEAGCELIRLLSIELLRILSIGSFGLTYLVDLLLEGFVFDPGKSDLILQICLGTHDGVPIIEVIV